MGVENTASVFSGESCYRENLLRQLEHIGVKPQQDSVASLTAKLEQCCKNGSFEEAAGLRRQLTEPSLAKCWEFPTLVYYLVSLGAEDGPSLQSEIFGDGQQVIRKYAESHRREDSAIVLTAFRWLNNRRDGGSAVSWLEKGLVSEASSWNPISDKYFGIECSWWRNHATLWVLLFEEKPASKTNGTIDIAAANALRHGDSKEVRLRCIIADNYVQRASLGDLYLKEAFQTAAIEHYRVAYKLAKSQGDRSLAREIDDILAGMPGISRSSEIDSAMCCAPSRDCAAHGNVTSFEEVSVIRNDKYYDGWIK